LAANHATSASISPPVRGPWHQHPLVKMPG
jgi:hypothetical protein